MAAERSGLIVDWGGVMTSDVFASFAAFCETEGLSPTTVRDLFLGDPRARELLADFECGRLGDADFEAQFGALLAVEQPAGLIGRLFGGLQPSLPMHDAVRAFRAAGVRTGMLSNSWGPKTYDPAVLAELFDTWVISGEEHMRKPQPEIYVLAAERMGLPPEQLIFVDDLRGNLKPARALGMATVHHVDAATTLTELEQLLGVALPTA